MKNRVDEIPIDRLESGKFQFRLETTANRSGEKIGIPVVVVKGASPGKTVGVVAAIHGDELNGISVIHNLYRHLDPAKMKGALIGVPVLNIPGFLRNQREFFDSRDLNRLMTGQDENSPAGQYVDQIKKKILVHFDCLIDLHTATSGRINTYHIRVNINHAESMRMARLMSPELIVHSPKAEGTTRYFFEKKGKPAITVEVGNPQILQDKLIDKTTNGVLHNLEYLEVIGTRVSNNSSKTTVCSESVWVYAKSGGLLEVQPKLGDSISKGDLVGFQTDLFGEKIQEYTAPVSGIVIGRKITASSQTGDRIIHIGIV